MMQFGFLGLSYKNAGLDIRDKTSFTDSKKIEFLLQMDEYEIEQCMILSTCNRSEIYYFYEKEEQRNQVRNAYKELFGERNLENYLVEYTKEKATEHLFRVTAGLESQVIGEDQILGQVKEALDFTRTMGYSKKEMNKVIRDAISSAKRIKTELKISEIPLSVSYVGIRQIDDICKILGKKILVIGSGKMTVLALRYLYEYGAKEVNVCSRTLLHAKVLRKEFSNIKIVEYENRYEVLKYCDIVISATASPHVVLKKENAIIERELYLLDLATPRDIDTAFAEDDKCHLINLDSLQQIVLENKKEREELVEKSQEIIKVEVEETQKWILSSRMDETIESLQQRCSEIVNDSFSYLDRKMDFTERDKVILRKTLNASLQRLIKEPIQELKKFSTKEEQDMYRELVHKLFRI